MFSNMLKLRRIGIKSVFFVLPAMLAVSSFSLFGMQPKTKTQLLREEFERKMEQAKQSPVKEPVQVPVKKRVPVKKQPQQTTVFTGKKVLSKEEKTLSVTEFERYYRDGIYEGVYLPGYFKMLKKQLNLIQAKNKSEMHKKSSLMMEIDRQIKAKTSIKPEATPKVVSKKMPQTKTQAKPITFPEQKMAFPARKLPPIPTTKTSKQAPASTTSNQAPMPTTGLSLQQRIELLKKSQSTSQMPQQLRTTTIKTTRKLPKIKTEPKIITQKTVTSKPVQPVEAETTGVETIEEPETVTEEEPVVTTPIKRGKVLPKQQFEPVISEPKTGTSARLKPITTKEGAKRRTTVRRKTRDPHLLEQLEE